MGKPQDDRLSARIRCGDSTNEEDALADAAPELLSACGAALPHLRAYASGMFTDSADGHDKWKPIEMIVRAINKAKAWRPSTTKTTACASGMNG